MSSMWWVWLMWGEVFLGPGATEGVTSAMEEKMEVWSCLAHPCMVCVLHWQRHTALCLLGTFCSKRLGMLTIL